MKKYLLFALAFLILYSLCPAQVPVGKEPRHHNIFENDHVRILDVHIPPGDTTQIHIHAAPSVFLILTNSVKVGSQVISEEKKAKLTTTAEENIWFEGFYIKPRIHRVWNNDTTEYHVMDIELPNKNYITLDSPIKQDAFTFLFEEIPVRGYRVNLGSSVNLSLPGRKADILIVRLTDSIDPVTVNEKSLFKRGDFIYVPSGKAISISDTGKEKTPFAFFELK